MKVLENISFAERTKSIYVNNNRKCEGFVCFALYASMERTQECERLGAAWLTSVWLWWNAWGNKLIMRKWYFGSQFWRFQFLISWSHCFGPVERTHIMVAFSCEIIYWVSNKRVGSSLQRVVLKATEQPYEKEIKSEPTNFYIKIKPK